MPEGVGYPEPRKRKRLRKLSPKEIEKEFHGKHKIENPPAKYKISKLTRKKRTRDILTQAQIKDDIKRFGEPTVVLTYNSTKRAARDRVEKHERDLRDAKTQAKREKFKRKTKKDDAKKSQSIKDKLKAERKKGNPDISKRKRK